MNPYIKKIFSHSIIYSIGNVFNRFLGFLLLPVYTFYFSPAEFGIYSLIYSFWFFAVVLYLFGMETSFQKMFLESDSESERKKIYGTALIQITGFTFILSIIMFFSADFISRILTGNQSNSFLLKILAALLIIDSFSRFPMLVINCLQKSKVYSIINTIGVVINVAANVILIAFMKFGIEAILYSFVGSYFAITIVSLIYSRKYFILSFDKAIGKKLFKDGHSFLYYGLFLISLDLIDRFILSYLKSDNEVGIYSACYRLGMVMNLAISGFRNAWIPFFMNIKEDENNKKIFSRVFTYFFFAGMFIFLTVNLFAEDLIHFQIGSYTFLNERYWSGLSILPFILLSYFFFGLYLNLIVGAFVENRTRYLIISTGVACFSNIILNFILIPPYSFYGAAIATLISYFIMFVILYFYSQKIFYINFEWGKIFVVVAFTAILYFASLILQNKIHFENPYFFTLIKSFLVLFHAIVLYKYVIFIRRDKRLF